MTTTQVGKHTTESARTLNKLDKVTATVIKGLTLLKTTFIL